MSSSPAFDLAVRQMNHAAKKLLGNRIRQGAKLYRREIHLPRLGIDPLLDKTTIVATLCNKLRAAKHAIASDHWASSGTNRIIALKIAICAERGYRP